MSDKKLSSDETNSGLVHQANNIKTDSNLLTTVLKLPEILKQVLMFLCPSSLFSFICVHKAARNMLVDCHDIVINSMHFLTNIKPKRNKEAFKRMKRVAIALVNRYEDLYPMTPEQMLRILNAKRCQFCNAADTLQFWECFMLWACDRCTHEKTTSFDPSVVNDALSIGFIYFQRNILYNISGFVEVPSTNNTTSRLVKRWNFITIATRQVLDRKWRSHRTTNNL